MKNKTCSSCLYFDKEYLFCTKSSEHVPKYHGACRDYEMCISKEVLK